MEYTQEQIKQAVGKSWSAGADYVIDTHRGAASRDLIKEFKRVGEIHDFSLNEKGTMIVLERIPPPKPVEPKPSVVQRVLKTKPDKGREGKPKAQPSPSVPKKVEGRPRSPFLGGSKK